MVRCLAFCTAQEHELLTWTMLEASHHVHSDRSTTRYRPGTLGIDAVVVAQPLIDERWVVFDPATYTLFRIADILDG